jgi:hypothetical protein
MKEKNNLVSLLAGILMMIAHPGFVKSDQTDKPINILIDKDIMTSEEAKSLEEEVMILRKMKKTRRVSVIEANGSWPENFLKTS